MPANRILCDELIFVEHTTIVCLHFVPYRAGSRLQPIRVYETGGAAEESVEPEMKSSEVCSSKGAVTNYDTRL